MSLLLLALLMWVSFNNIPKIPFSQQHNIIIILLLIWDEINKAQQKHNFIVQVYNRNVFLLLNFFHPQLHNRIIISLWEFYHHQISQKNHNSIVIFDSTPKCLTKVQFILLFYFYPTVQRNHDFVVIINITKSLFCCIFLYKKYFNFKKLRFNVLYCVLTIRFMMVWQASNALVKLDTIWTVLFYQGNLGHCW